MVCGNRFGRGLVRPGGCRHDLGPDLAAKVLERLDRALRDVERAEAWFLRLRLGARTPRERRRRLPLAGRGDRDGRPAARASGSSGTCGTTIRPGGIASPRPRWPCGPAATCWPAPACARWRSGARGLPPRAARRAPGRRAPRRPRPARARHPRRGARRRLAGRGLPRGADRRRRTVPSLQGDRPVVPQLDGPRARPARQAISDFPVCNKSFNLSYCGFDL